MKKSKQFLALLVSGMILLSACGGGDTTSSKASTGSTATNTASTDTNDDTAEAPSGAPAEGQDTNYGRPYNLTPTKYDTRDDKYLNGINATILPITEEPVEITIWRDFSSTVMQGLDESEVFQELERRTNVKINWVYPPTGSKEDNFTLRVASGDLPHIFSTPPEYAGGVAKAVSDEVYADLTPYYDQGLMPNIKYLREANPDIDRDFKDDEGRMLFFPMVDIVPTDPWSGIWIRQDWLDELGMEVPTTIEEWDTMLYAMKDLKGGFPLANNVRKIDSWYGVRENYMFVGSYEAGFQRFLNKNGTVVYGSIEPGYKDWLTLMNKWYADGILDPDFSTRTNDDYNANVANGVVGAFGLAYGELGQQKLTGTTLDPNYKLVPVINPTSYDGQVIHLHQDNSTVRYDKEHMTTRAIDDGVDEIIVRWKDYWYSQDGGDLCSYGIEGTSYKWGSDGEVEWIHPSLTENEDADFWTLYPLFKLHNWGYLRDSSSYEFEPEVMECIETWDSQDASWLMPDNIAFTPDEAKELAGIETDVDAYVEESTLKFITGQMPLSEFDAYVKNVEQLNIARAVEIRQAALDRYNAR